MHLQKKRFYLTINIHCMTQILRKCDQVICGLILFFREHILCLNSKENKEDIVCQFSYLPCKIIPIINAAIFYK